MRCARRAAEEMLSHRLLVDTREGVVYERKVTLFEFATVHTEGRCSGDLRYPLSTGRFRIAQLKRMVRSAELFGSLLEVRLD